MEKNYYCNEVWFYSYEQARLYSETMLKLEGKYYVVFTKAEMDSMVRDMVESVIDTINHEEECGK